MEGKTGKWSCCLSTFADSAALNGDASGIRKTSAGRRKLLPGHDPPTRDGAPYMPDNRPVHLRSPPPPSYNHRESRRPASQAIIGDGDSGDEAVMNPARNAVKPDASHGRRCFWTDHELTTLLVLRSRGLTYRKIAEEYLPNHGKNACEAQFLRLRNRYLPN
ncbi:hypothetical protein B0T16DRAFT_513157 [Cercophora newfieldiana]|uniref:Myb-like domain-containing protein n=1 Tax=Cercophora newfieldiana TaxID=92897 RepID=A0AA40CLX7_9PEZI|nr:hypothetical protein B0T16DRAFT_513157 [Cercophora newfieldiana]